MFKGIPVASCDETLTASSSSQSLTSPNYPQNYGNDLNCVYTISGDDIITIVFEAFSVSKTNLVTFKMNSFYCFLFPNNIKTVIVFQVEQHSSCGWDYLKVQEDDGSGNLVQIENLCGPALPLSHITSSGNNLVLHFWSDYTVNKGGFKIHYYSGQWNGGEF